jgi:hypothetical protein
MVPTVTSVLLVNQANGVQLVQPVNLALPANEEVLATQVLQVNQVPEAKPVFPVNQVTTVPEVPMVFEVKTETLVFQVCKVHQVPPVPTVLQVLQVQTVSVSPALTVPTVCEVPKDQSV